MKKVQAPAPQKKKSPQVIKSSAGKSLVKENVDANSDDEEDIPEFNFDPKKNSNMVLYDKLDAEASPSKLSKRVDKAKSDETETEPVEEGTAQVDHASSAKKPAKKAPKMKVTQGRAREPQAGSKRERPDTK